MRRGALFLAAVLGACSFGTATAVPTPVPAASPSPFVAPAMGPPQYRAIWVDAFHDGIKTKKQVDKLIADAQRANVNTLIVQVRPSGNAYFNKSIEPRSSDPGLAPEPYDPLAYVLEKAHAANPPLQVWAWLNTYAVSR